MGFDPDMSLKFDGDIMRLSRLSWHTTNDAMMWFKNDIGCNVASLALYNYIYIHNMFKINGYCSRADWFGYPPDSSDPWTLFLNLRRWWTLVGAFFGGDEKTYCGEYCIYIYIYNKHCLIPRIDVIQPMPWRIH